MAIDPVCKMEVDKQKAAATAEYKGEKYYFCAVGCQKAFDETWRNTWLREKQVVYQSFYLYWPTTVFSPNRLNLHKLKHPTFNTT